MKRTTSLRISVLLLFTMLFSLLAPLTGLADGIQLKINGLDETTETSPNQLTTSTMTLPVTINGITADQINSIYYEITNMNTGVVSVNKTNKAVKNANNANEVIFSGVTLTEGLNKIIAKYGEATVVSSPAVWVQFTSVTNITDLKLNDVALNDNEMYPKNAPYTSLSITGTASNATRVQAYVNGTAYDPVVFNRGNFTFITNTGRNNDLALKPGDNEMRLISTNNSNTYYIDRTFVYDNGLAFAYDAWVKSSTAAADQYQKLAAVPTVSKDTTVPVTVKAKLKVPVNSSNQLLYKEVNVGVGGQTPIKYSLTSGTAEVTEDTSASVDSKYKIYNFEATMNTKVDNKYQPVTFDFVTTDTDLIQSGGQYAFYVVDPNTPYVSYMEHSVPKGLTVKVNEVGSTQLNRFPSTLKVYTTENATSVKMEVNNNDFKTVDTVASTIQDANGNTLKVWNFDIDTLADGISTIKVTPIGPNGVNAQGSKTYLVQISGAPYVILDGIYNGQVFTSASKIMCGNDPGPCLKGRVVNLPEIEKNNVVLQVNETQFSMSQTYNEVSDSSLSYDGSFTIQPGTLAVDGKTKFSDVMKADGKKTIVFSIKVGGKVITESKFEIFILSDNVPYINSVIPLEENPDSKVFKTVNTDEYATTEDAVTLTGSVRNATTYTVEYTVPGETAKTSIAIASKTQAYDSDTDKITFTETFITKSVPLAVNGDYIFQITASNASGVQATKTVKISKEAHPYVIKLPEKLFTNENGKTQANINKNFQRIEIKAEGAISVLFGKEEVFPRSGLFVYEAKGLKAGANEIKFTVNRGTAQNSGSLVLYNVNTPIEGAQYKSEVSSMKVFGGDLEMKIGKDVKMMRNERTSTNNFLTNKRELLFGIANVQTGIVDKDLEFANSLATQSLSGAVETYRFKPASKLFWIDAGTISDQVDAGDPAELKGALEGSGTLPLISSDSDVSSALQPIPFYQRYDLQDLVVPTQPVTLTFKYDPTITADAWKYVTVFQYGTFADRSGAEISAGVPVSQMGWKNLGGVVDSKKNTITVTVPEFGYFQVMYMNDSFNDVTNHGWARDIIDTLYSKGYMFNKDSGGSRFLPDDAITRGEFVTLLVKVFDIPLTNPDTSNPDFQGTFGDVRKGVTLQNSINMYDYLHIEAGARAGIVRGTSQGLFLPNEAITRQDAAVMIARAAELKMGTDEAKVQASLDKLFTDSTDPKFSYYAKPAVEAVTKAGFIEGRPNTLLAGQTQLTNRFDPVDNITRAESAAIALRVLAKLKKVPK
ncbi:S-layer homology domain-containing protein [Paenibacillus sp. S-38]|uniref:S-layer homology domain-containing protein n=1 Tax=Paenibacillus sp. S-38 TaxID=3416710 RepID=UPI003CEBF100